LLASAPARARRPAADAHATARLYIDLAVRVRRISGSACPRAPSSSFDPLQGRSFPTATLLRLRLACMLGAARLNTDLALAIAFLARARPSPSASPSSAPLLSTVVVDDQSTCFPLFSTFLPSRTPSRSSFSAIFHCLETSMLMFSFVRLTSQPVSL
jgi:hypothetical protein